MPGQGQSVTVYKFTMTFLRIQIWQLDWDGYLVFILMKILIIHIFPKALKNFGGDGISPCRRGFGIMSIFLWEVIEKEQAGHILI